MTSRFQFLSTDQWPKHVKIVEVGPRDGLQNEKVPLYLHCWLYVHMYVHALRVIYGTRQYLLLVQAMASLHL